MFFEFVCEKCGKKLKIREENVGGRVRCPHCQHTQLVEGPSTTDVETPFSFIPQEPDAAKGGAGAAKSTPPPQAMQWTDATQVSMWVSAGIGVGVFVLFYALMLLISGTHFAEVFLKRGPVQFVMVYLTGWSIGILLLKYRKLSVQRASILLDLLPSEIEQTITVDSVDRFVRHIRGLPVRHGESFLVNRVLRGLEHFRVLNNSGEVADRLATQSDIDANQVTSSYTLLKVFIWAIPILGFIGTVVGIGTAVGGFSGSLNAEMSDMTQLKESLMTVTGGLATAFDTTLVALCFSIVIMFPTSWMQKSEEDMLNSVDEYCNENLLKRLKGEAAASPGARPPDAKDLQAAVNAALAEHHAELAAWTKKLESVGETLGEKTIERWSRLDGEFHQRHTAAYQKLGSSAESFQQQLAKLHQGLRGLNRVLAELGEKQIVIERRSWWSRWGRRNGED
jgi:biopolymer transport protein ExbB/TolQ/DNA-directed RNA polymerase subunit RPC12/RpoP